MERFAKLAADALNRVLEAPIQATDLEIPPDPKLGDFAMPCFRLAQQFRKGPPQIAQEITKKVQESGKLPASLTVAPVGPYVNFTVRPENVFRDILADILKPGGGPHGSYGQLQAESRGTRVLEFSSPNVAKPLNIYHLRPTALGAALDRVGRFRGFKIVSINHLGDWGKQYGMLVTAFRRYGIGLETPLSMKELVDLYVRINADAKKDPEIEKEARDAFLKLEKGDLSITAFWKKCVDVSMVEFNRIYKRLGIHFDHIWGESYYKDRLQPLIADLRKRGLLVESEGALVVPVTDEDGKELPPCIIQKSDGATIYATRDIAAAIYRMEKFHFDRMTYIVGGEQRLHFKQVFAVLKKMGFEWVSRCEHVPTGLYRFKDAKMSTRDGNYITLEEVIELAKSRVAKLMSERAATQPEGAVQPPVQATDEITEKIALGAVVFHDLQTDPARDVDFDVERVVDFEGETGPYLQYAHTRCLSILRKARAIPAFSAEIAFGANHVSKLTAPEELALVKVLGRFPLHLERTLRFAKASQLASYLIDVARAFGSFYRECHVIDEADPELTRARLMLVEATRRILGQGLSLLGIPLPERM